MRLDVLIHRTALLHQPLHYRICSLQQAARARTSYSQQPKTEKLKTAYLLSMCYDDLTSCLCGYLCCACCLSGAAADNRSRSREYRGGPSRGPMYVQPVVVTTAPMNGRAYHGGHQPNDYYYVQSNQVGHHPPQHGPYHKRR